MHLQTIADDNSGITKSNECCFIETKSPSLIHLHHQHQHRRIKSSLNDAAMHFSPPSKDSINTDFTNLHAISESGRNSVSRQSLIGEFILRCFCCFHPASLGLWCFFITLLFATGKAIVLSLFVALVIVTNLGLNSSSTFSRVMILRFFFFVRFHSFLCSVLVVRRRIKLNYFTISLLRAYWENGLDTELI